MRQSNTKHRQSTKQQLKLAPVGREELACPSLPEGDEKEKAAQAMGLYAQVEHDRRDARGHLEEREQANRESDGCRPRLERRKAQRALRDTKMCTGHAQRRAGGGGALRAARASRVAYSTGSLQAQLPQRSGHIVEVHLAQRQLQRHGVPHQPGVSQVAFV